jgi:hypothetical protein
MCFVGGGFGVTKTGLGVALPVLAVQIEYTVD